MSFTNPTVADFKAHFVRDFPYSADEADLTKVTEADITRAISDADVMINEGLFGDQATYNVGFLSLAAHNLVMNLRASSQGVGGQFAWLQNSHSVGGMSESFSIPAQISDSPQLAMLTKTNYGAKYLMLVLPQLVGRIFITVGDTNP